MFEQTKELISSNFEKIKSLTVLVILALCILGLVVVLQFDYILFTTGEPPVEFQDETEGQIYMAIAIIQFLCLFTLGGIVGCVSYFLKLRKQRENPFAQRLREISRH